ncbi:MAG: DUF2306 domain-containing protein [Nonlabens sp.]|nr:DUF2306 domain-containing protein [Nonlabens sp.]MDP5101549.1 DUF2306 domain-containing protein [Nonlabens sp.]
MSNSTYLFLMYSHIVTVAPCIFLGAYLFIRSKGTPGHRFIGKIYMSLMLITASITLFMPAAVGPQFLGHFGFIHLFSILTLYSIPTAILAIKRGNVRKHKIKLTLLYIGAIVIAGGFTFAPGRYMHELFFG